MNTYVMDRLRSEELKLEDMLEQARDSEIDPILNKMIPLIIEDGRDGWIRKTYSENHNLVHCSYKKIPKIGTVKVEKVYEWVNDIFGGDHSPCCIRLSIANSESTTCKNYYYWPRGEATKEKDLDLMSDVYAFVRYGKGFRETAKKGIKVIVEDH